jgi:hypothetical protein
VVKVIPHAFFHKKGHKSVYEMTYDQFLNNATAHVTGQRAPLSEFSSWSQSPYFAFNYAMHAKRMRHGNIHVAIIDAEALIASNPAFNVAALHKIFKQAFAPNYHEEYLVHGILQGCALRSAMQCRFADASTEYHSVQVSPYHGRTDTTFAARPKTFRNQ